MFEMVVKGGILMVPILFCSVVALGISIERIWALRPSRIAPVDLLDQVWGWIKNNQLNNERLANLKSANPLGELLAAGLSNSRHGRTVMKESIEDAAVNAVHNMEKYTNTLGIIAVIAPLLGLLGTVLGMIKVFTTIVTVGTGDPSVLASGISEALVTTAAGLFVGIPALVLHKVILRRIDSLVVFMELESVRLVDKLHGERGA